MPTQVATGEIEPRDEPDRSHDRRHHERPPAVLGSEARHHTRRTFLHQPEQSQQMVTTHVPASQRAGRPRVIRRTSCHAREPLCSRTHQSVMCAATGHDQQFSDTQIRTPDNGGYACATSARGGCGASWAHRIAGDVRAPLPAAVPAGSGRARKARLICSGAAGRLNCLMGVQLGFMGVQLGGKGHLGWFAGAAAAVRGLPGSSGRLSPCLSDDGAPRCGCRRPVLACSWIPADRGHRFRRSGARTGHAAGRRRRYSLVGCRPGRPLSC